LEQDKERSSIVTGPRDDRDARIEEQATDHRHTHGTNQPTASYVAEQIEGTWFWVERTDYASKVAFTILEILKSVAESPSAIAPPVLTIPAG
jgi:hypothetical protein